ncbi:MAG TPA: hypothetical protein VMV10_33120 [Pirellulales bacterium]|nr:hypothetical protein [Pirellulales bacterium]
MRRRTLFHFAIALAWVSLASGCGGETPVARKPVEQPPAEHPRAASASQPAKPKPSVVAPTVAPDLTAKVSPLASPPATASEPAPASPTQKAAVAAPAPPPIDDERVAAQGIHKLASKHLTLYTDLPLDDEVKALPDAFDQAYPQWRAYVGLAGREAAPWHVVGRLMNDEAKFRAAGLLPDDLPEFPNGYTRDNEIWWREQQSAYYRRHLMLHEGTHSFMYAHFGTCGPAWYMEGLAELLGTHSFAGGKVKLDVFPVNRDDVPYWGRVKLVRDDIDAGRTLSLEQVLRLEPGLYSTVESYGWCWATAAFLDGHPRYRERFRRLPAELQNPDFNARVKAAFASDWSDLNEEWQCFTADLEYGYDLERNVIEFAPGEPLSAGGAQVNVAVERGWQATGLRLEAGKTYRLAASGRFQIASKPRVWRCEANGITIRYHGGRPLGMLLAAVHPEPYDAACISSFLSPIEIGLGAEWTPTESGTLYLRINDSPAELADNAGSLQVQVSAE